MPKRGKAYQEAIKLVEKNKLYELDEAIKLVKQTAKAKFDETVELHIKLGVDGRHADQQVRGAIVLPHGTGKTKRVLVIAKGEKAIEAEKAGADFVGAEDIITKIQNENWFDYDVIVSTPDMMGQLGRLGRVLGPKGLMPNPKAGTVEQKTEVVGAFTDEQKCKGAESLVKFIFALSIRETESRKFSFPAKL